MQYADRHPAAARDGPLADHVDLTVPKQEGEKRWPTPVVWSTRAGERHIYELMAVKVVRNLALFPVYTFRRTLSFG